MKWSRRPLPTSRVEETLARLEMTAEVIEKAADRLESSARDLAALTDRHLHSLEQTGGPDAEA